MYISSYMHTILHTCNECNVMKNNVQIVPIYTAGASQFFLQAAVTPRPNPPCPLAHAGCTWAVSNVGALGCGYEISRIAVLFLACLSFDT